MTIFAVLLTVLGSVEAQSQSWVAEAQQNGFTLKKVESDTAINIGQTFSYTVYFSIPAGATNVTITDVLPASIQFLSSAFISPCGAPTVVSPAISAMGGTYSLSWASVPLGCSGSFTITAQFPGGVTCNGTTARNRVCLQGTLPTVPAVDLCTPFVSIRAIAVEPWNITKWVTGAAYQGGTCPYATSDTVITYQVCVYKNVGTTGQLNLVGGLVTDLLPTGAILQSSTCGATQSGDTIKWAVGNLSATLMYNSACCTFNVLYPRALFPNGTQITNKAILTGTLGSTQPSCGNLADTSNTTCVEIKTVNSATLSKWVYTNTQPGCTGRYLVYVCNNGTTPLTTFTITDTVPTSLTGLSLGTVSAGLSANLVLNVVTVTNTTPLAPGQCRSIEINFTIPATATVGSTITNCAWFTSPGFAPITACASFVVSAPAPKACVWKEVCSKLPSYTPGQTFRYRLRVQNIGGQPLSGATITDVLNNNLQFVGNVSYYSSLVWNTPCSLATTWTGVTVSYNPTSNTVVATLPAIPAVCQNIFFSNCGMYGTSGVPFYFLEFDVKVVDTSALGNIPNAFTISGGTLSGPVTSNTEYVTVVGTAGFTLAKAVKKIGATTYNTLASTTAGGGVSYRLRLAVPTGSIALRHVTFADLLPRNNGTNDQLILGPCTLLGSAFDVTWSSPLASLPPASPYNNPLSFARVNNFAPTGAPGPMFVGGCGTLGTWPTGLSAGAKNLGYYFGPAPIGAGFNATAEFNATVSGAAQVQDISCNTFAANAAVRHLIASTIVSDQIIGQLESNTACVDVVNAEGCLDSLRLKIDCALKDSAGNQQYNFTVTGWNASSAGVLMMSSPQGIFSPSSFAIPTGSFSISGIFTDTPPVSGIITIHWALVINGQVICRDSVVRDLPPCPSQPPDDCCKEFIRRVDHLKITYNNAGGVQLLASMTAGPNPIKQFSATIVSVQRRTVCNNIASAWQRSFGDIIGGSISTPLSPGPLLLQLYSREAQWGPGECLSFLKGVNLKLNMIFPAPPASFKCSDTLIFAIRYSFTDCKCVTCTELVYDTVVRRVIFLPWENTGWTAEKITRGGLVSGVKGADAVQVDTATFSAVVMEDQTKGSLWVVNPARADNTITIVGAEISAPTSPLVSLSTSVAQGIMNGSTGFVPLDVPPGSTQQVSLLFNNPLRLMQFPVDVRYLFTDGSGGTAEFSSIIRYTARVPNGTPDVVVADPATKPTNVRTYAIMFSNSNAYREIVTAVRIRTTGATRILAVGPASADATSALLALYPNDTEGHTISSAVAGNAGVAPGVTVKPIYLMLSGAEGASLDLSFESYDATGGKISEGTFTLTDPISRVNGGVEGPRQQFNSIHPNPAGSQITVSLSLEQSVSDGEVVVTDMQGSPVITLQRGVYDQGTHILQADVGSLAQGSYTIVFRSSLGSITYPLRIVK